MSDQNTQEQPKTGGSDASNNTVMGVLAYILFFIPLLTGDYKKSDFVKFHTNQGTVLFIFAIGWWIVCAILAFVLAFLLAFIFNNIGWWLYRLLFWVLRIVPTILCILGIINAVKGETNPLPVIGKFTIIK